MNQSCVVIQFPLKSVETPSTSIIITDKLLQNDKCCIELRSDKEIFGRDLTDRNNEPAFYNKSVRGLKKAWTALTAGFNNDTTMYGAMGILRQSGIKCHSWCTAD